LLPDRMRSRVRSRDLSSLSRLIRWIQSLL
jgi:hypothetical protein